jgi:beta-galactosidase/beta-glucuronidase
MRKMSNSVSTVLAGLILFIGAVRADNPSSSNWKKAEAPLMTQWAAAVGPDNALPEYPRPQMVRKEWKNLNGLWDYAITAVDAANPPGDYAGKILVPYPVQSALSGVMKHFDEKQRLWYRRTFEVPAAWAHKRVLIHFGAVNWDATVKLNGKVLGEHRGDYDGFTFDLTDALKPSGPQELEVSVIDPISAGYHAHGKQVTEPGVGGIFYTASSGIWQTVWLEPVSQASIDGLKITPDVDGSAVKVTVTGKGTDANDEVSVSVLDGKKVVSHVSQPIGEEISIPVPHPQLWSPDHPFLYGLKIALRHGGMKTDSVESYFGMRKIAMAKDAKGVLRLFLNGEQIFMHGPLDQGYWPDGVYTAPTDEALRSDIEMTKKYGFNCTRKHVKVEPDRWYYWCDKLGLLVWQDMPSANVGSGTFADTPRTPEDAAQFEGELKALFDGRGNHPCIVIWVLFNEGGGQYHTVQLTAWAKSYDPGRLVDTASGWNNFNVGDLNDCHSYPGPWAPFYDGFRASVNGESGALAAQVPGHMWPGTPADRGKNDQLAPEYADFVSRLWPMIDSKDLCAEIYTQLTDVEGENNGLMTYDRIPKADVAAIAKANEMPAVSSSAK